jgi:hypothetical protein
MLSDGISPDASRITADYGGSSRLSILTLVTATRSTKTGLHIAAYSLNSIQETMFIHLLVRKKRVTNLVEMVLMGVVATIVMDLVAPQLAKVKIIHPLIGPEAVGRWILYMFRGKFIHTDINKTPPLNNERMVSLLFHYLIGIGLAGVYLLLEARAPAIRHQLWMPLIFGIATVLLPWFWLYPSIGIGVLASKAEKKSRYIINSLVNHTNFGLGLLIWVAIFRRFLM